MPGNKNQHYVPKAHLRPFTLNEAGDAINVLNIAGEALIRNAPTKGQCSHDYFYGKDGALEKALQEPEGEYAALVKLAVTNPPSLDGNGLKSLLNLTMLQAFRSFGTVEKLLATVGGFGVAVVSPDGTMPEDWQEFTQADAVRMSMRHALDMREHVEDLDCVLVVNEAKRLFVTSDDPAVHTNRYHAQRLPGVSAGYSSAGTMLYLPLSPRRLFLAFDPFAYHAPSRKGFVVTVSNDSDVDDLNQFQFLHARRNIYFYDWDSRECVREALKVHAPHRPTSWHTTTHWIPAEKGKDTGRYVVASEEVAKDYKTSIIQESLTQVVASPWPSIIRYRLKPKVLDTGTGRGHARPGHPSLKDRFEDFERRARVRFVED